MMDRHVQTHDGTADWGGIAAMTLCAILMVGAEWSPVYLLTPMAQDLGITTGQAGQALSVSGIFAIAGSLLSGRMTAGRDRGRVFAGYAALMILPLALIAMAPNVAVVLVGRALAGFAAGGFWSMGTAMILRLLPPDRVLKGIAVLNIGVAIAGAIWAPVGVAVAGLIGWQTFLLGMVPLGALVVAILLMRLPRIPPVLASAGPNPLALLREGPASLGMSATFLTFMGNFAIFYYLRPYLETGVGLGTGQISLGLLGLGLSGLVGTWVVSRLLRNKLWLVLIGLPLLMSLVVVGMVLAAGQIVIVGLLLCLWGFLATAVPVGWNAWLAAHFPDRAETAGGLQIATIQIAIMTGSAIGGQVFDLAGWQATFGMGAGLLVAATLAAIVAAGQASAKTRPRNPS